MRKIEPKDGLMYITNLFLRFISKSPLEKAKTPEGQPAWTDQSVAKLLEKKGYVKIVSSPHGKAYSYVCIKGITQHELFELITVEDFYLNVKKPKDKEDPAQKKSS